MGKFQEMTSETDGFSVAVETRNAGNNYRLTADRTFKIPLTAAGCRRPIS